MPVNCTVMQFHMPCCKGLAAAWGEDLCYPATEDLDGISPTLTDGWQTTDDRSVQQHSGEKCGEFADNNLHLVVLQLPYKLN